MLNNIFKYKILWGIFFIYFLTSSAIFAQQELPLDLKVVFPQIKQRMGKFSYTSSEFQSLKNICHSFGKNLSQNQGPIGGGIVKNYSCYIDNQIFEGNTDINKQKLYLELFINFQTSKDTIITIHRIHKINKNIQKILEAQITIPYSQMALSILQDPNIVQLTAHALLSQMYAYGIANDLINQSSSDQYISLPQLIKDKDPLAPLVNNILIYTLSLTPNLQWKASVVASADFIENKGNKSIWSIKWKNKNIKDKILWFKFNHRRDASLDLTLSSINAIASKISQKSQNANIIQKAKQEIVYSLAAGYIGVRYAYPYLNSDAMFFKDTPMYGVFVETRGGILNGLRFYYDQTPKRTKISVLGEKLKYFSSRLSLGVAFQKDFLIKIIDNINITPKFGSWAFTAVIPLDANGKLIDSVNSDVYYLEISRAYTLGLEVGIEKFWKNILLRAWLNSDLTANNIFKTSKGKVSSYRYGVDIHIGGPSLIGKFSLSFLVFTFGELLNLESDTRKHSDENQTKYYIENVVLTNSFAGGGISLAW